MTHKIPDDSSFKSLQVQMTSNCLIERKTVMMMDHMFNMSYNIVVFSIAGRWNGQSPRSAQDPGRWEGIYVRLCVRCVRTW